MEDVICGFFIGEDVIESLQCMPTVSMIYEKASFMIMETGIMVVAIDWADSKAVAITVLEICMMFTHMVHGGGWKSIANRKTLVTIQMDISFVWSPVLLGMIPQ